MQNAVMLDSNPMQCNGENFVDNELAPMVKSTSEANIVVQHSPLDESRGDVHEDLRVVSGTDENNKARGAPQEPIEHFGYAFWQKMDSDGIFWCNSAGELWSIEDMRQQLFMLGTCPCPESYSLFQQSRLTAENGGAGGDHMHGTENSSLQSVADRGSAITALPPPPGVFFTESWSSTADVAYRDGMTHGWEWWQGQNTSNFEASHEAAGNWESTCSAESSTRSRRANRRNAPIYVGQHLAWLESKDSDCVCILRKIHQLGANAADTLCEYFKHFGPVEKVLLSNAPAEGATDVPIGMRCRPSGMGWILMCNKDDAAKVNSQKYHQIGHVLIYTESFVSKGSSGRPDKIDDVVEDQVACDDMLSYYIAGLSKERWSDMSE